MSFLGGLVFWVFFKVDSMVLYCQLFSKPSSYKNSFISEDTRHKPAMAHRMTIQRSAHKHMITLAWVPSQAELGLLSSKSHMCVLVWYQHQTNLYTAF